MNSIPLDYIGIEEGTDKSSLAGNYLRRYEELFTPLRDEAFNLVEIGILGGASLRMWNRFFTEATLVGLDINPGCARYQQGRVKVEIGSQADPETLRRIAESYPPLVVIDDGSHRSDHIIFTFETLFPAVLQGGYYIVEDLHFHAMPDKAEQLKRESEITAIEYFLNLARIRLSRENPREQAGTSAQYLRHQVAWIEFISGAVIIAKREAANAPSSAEEIRPHVERTTDWRAWLRLANLMRKNGRHTDAEVIPLLQRAIELNDTAVGAYRSLSEILEAKGDRAGAVEVLERAVAKCRKTHLAGLEGRLRRLRDVV